MSANLTALLWMAGSIAMATVMTVSVRVLSGDVPTPMLAFLRSLFGVLMVLPFLMPGRRDALRFTLWRYHVGRGLLIVLALNSGFYAISVLPLATATILFFMAPVYTTLLAGPMLGERVGPWRWGAVLAGFTGALVILRPGAAAVDPAMLWALVSSAAFAFVLLLGKRAAETDGPNSVFVSSNLIVGVGTIPPALFVWTVPEITAPGGLALWGLILVLMLTSNLRGYFDIRAYTLGEAGFLAPFSYLRLLSIGAIGYLMFDETPDLATVAGGVIIIAATLVIAFREHRKRVPRPPETSTAQP